MRIYKQLSRLEPELEIKESKITNERQYWISLFLEELNKGRRGKYKPLTAGFVASKMADAGLKTEHLQEFYDECKRSGNFSRSWWSLLKAS